MPKTLAALVLTAWLAPMPAAVPWETKLDRASAAALARNQPMLIEFWAVACEGCREMDRDVYVDERVAAAMAKVRPVKIDVDRDKVAARKYDIAATPTIVVTDSFGGELVRTVGALSAERLLQLLGALPADVGAINRLAAAARKKDDFAALADLGRELRAAGFYRASSGAYERALGSPDGRRPGAARTAVLVDLERNALELRRFADAARFAAQALAAGDDPDVAVDLGRALGELGKRDEADRVLRQVVGRHAGTPAAAAAARLLAGR